MRRIPILLTLIFLFAPACKAQRSEIDESSVRAVNSQSEVITLNGYRFNSKDTSCDGLPLLPINTASGYCVGFLAAGDPKPGSRGHNKIYNFNGRKIQERPGPNLVWPRRIVWDKNSESFYMSDLGGWGKAKGSIWKLTVKDNSAKIKTVFTKLKTPHGLQVHPTDGKVYFGTQTTIYRFDPKAENPASEVVISGLPGEIKTREGALGRPKKNPNGNGLVHGDPVAKWNENPLKHFIFDKTGKNFFINIGAPDDGCYGFSKPNERCEIADYMAGIWKVPVVASPNPIADPQTGKPFDLSIVYATGLRNSMAIWQNPKNEAIIQIENSLDFSDKESPFEELNIIEKGGNYGWPYYYEYGIKTSLKNAGLDPVDHKYSTFAMPQNQVKAPYAILPSHAAALDLIFYTSNYFPELTNQYIASYHGWRPTGHRVAKIAADPNTFMPVLKQGGSKFSTDDAPDRQLPLGPDGKGLDISNIITDWGAVSQTRPRGRPVGMAVDSKGRILIVDDRNSMIMRIGKPSAGTVQIINRNIHLTETEINFVAKNYLSDPVKANELQKIRSNILEKYLCTGCHRDVMPASSDTPEVAIKKLLKNRAWVQPGDLQSSIIKAIEGGSMPKGMAEKNQELVASPDFSILKKLITDIGGPAVRVNTNRGGLTVRSQTGDKCGSVAKEHENTISAIPEQGHSLRELQQNKKMVRVLLSVSQKDDWISNSECQEFFMGSWLLKAVNP